MKNIVRTVKSWAALGALGLASLSMTSPAAAVSFNSQFSASRANSPGTTFVNMTASATTFCYLSGVGVDNADAENETPRCLITRGAVVWTLQALLGSAADDADVVCNAICYNN